MKKSELIEKINAFVATIFPQEEKKEELKEEVIDMGAPIGNQNAAGPHNKRHADMPGLNNPYRKGSKKYVEREKRVQKAYYPKKVGRPKVNMEEDINNIELMEIEIGNVLPDGEYNINGDIVTILNGVVSEIIPEEEKSEEKPAEETVVEEEMKEEKPTEKLSAQEPEVKINLEDERNKIRVEFEKEYNEKLEDIKKEFNTKLEKLAESVKTTGIVQAPVETKPEVLSDADWLIKNRKK